MGKSWPSIVQHQLYYFDYIDSDSPDYVVLVEVLGWAPLVVPVKVEDGGSIGPDVGGGENFRFDLVDVEVFHNRSCSYSFSLCGCAEGSLGPVFVDELVAEMMELIRSGDEFVASVSRGCIGDGAGGDSVYIDHYISKGVGGGCCRGAEYGKNQQKKKHKNDI